MKNKTSEFLKACSQVVTEVPGWPDAPFRARLSRSLPIFFPIAAISVILIWNIAYYAPRAAVEKEMLQPMLNLENEISSLQMGSSQQQLAELNEQTATVTRLLLDSPKELPNVLQELKAAIQKSGWDATFQIGEVVDETPSGSASLQITYLPVRGRLKAQTGNQERFTSLLPILERLSSSGKRIDLTRLAIRADEARWQPVEINFRLACPAIDAKTL